MMTLSLRRLPCRVKPYGNVIYDAEVKLFKMWYDSEPDLEYFPANSMYSYYAVSRDGVATRRFLAVRLDAAGFRGTADPSRPPQSPAGAEVRMPGCNQGRASRRV